MSHLFKDGDCTSESKTLNAIMKQNIQHLKVSNETAQNSGILSHLLSTTCSESAQYSIF